MEKNNTNDEKEKLILVNTIEEPVKLLVRESMKELGACGCETCYLNACALALNSLEPKYVTTTKGALYSKVEGMELNNQANILVAVTKAVMQVMKHPHH